MIDNATMDHLDSEVLFGWDSPGDGEPQGNPVALKQPCSVPTKEEVVELVAQGRNPAWAVEPLTKQVIPVPADARAWFSKEGNLRGTSEPIEGRCGRKLARTSPARFCSQWPLKGRTACKFCGGATPVGAASPHFKTGIGSRYIPTFLREAYDDVAADPDINSLRQEIRVQKAMAMTNLRRMGEVQPPDWAKLKSLLKDVSQVRTFEDAAPILTEVCSIVEEGIASQKQMDALEARYNDAVDRTARLGTAEWKRLVDLQGMVTLEQVTFLLRGLLQSQRTVLKDHRELLQQCQQALLTYLPAPARKEQGG